MLQKRELNCWNLEFDDLVKIMITIEIYEYFLWLLKPVKTRYWCSICDINIKYTQKLKVYYTLSQVFIKILWFLQDHYL